MIKCLKAMSRFSGEEAPPVVLKRESLSNAGFLAEALAELCKRAEIDFSACKLILSNLKHPGLWKTHPVDTGAFQRLVEALDAFCKKHKKALSAAYRQDKDFFMNLYQKRVLKRKVLLVHSPNDAPDLVVKNLSSGAFYDVEARPLDHAVEKSPQHHITVFLCTDAKEATEFFLRKDRMGIDLFLSDLGRELPVLNMSLCRIVNQALRSGMKFLSPPYATMKLLPAVEEAFVHHLEAFDRAIATQEKAMAQEEEELFRGMAEAELYAELIVEAHWMKTAGFNMEKSLSEAGK
jgi:hypothetical protein